MCFIIVFSKYISVPVLTEWLSRTDLLLFDASLVNRSEPGWLLSLMSEYSSLVHDKMFLLSVPENEVSLLELCGWYRRFGLPVEVLCRIRISMFDFTLISKYDWMSSCEEVLNRAVNVNVELGMYDRISSCHLLFCLTRTRSLTLFSCQAKVLNFIEQCALLTSLIIKSNLDDEDLACLSLVCRVCPLLETIALNNYLDGSPLSDAIAVHCKQLKTLKCLNGSRNTSRNAFIFAFHAVSSDLTDIDWDVFSDKDSLVRRTRLWYKGSKLTHLNIHHNQLRKHSNVRSMMNVISNTCSGLCTLKLRCVDDDNDFEAVSELFSHCLSDVSFRDFTPHRVVAACMSCPLLQTLHIQSSSVLKSLSNSDLLTIVHSCPLLVNFDLWCINLSEGCVALIAPHIGNVSSLTVRCTSFTVEDCAAVAQYMKKLRHLDVEVEPLQSNLIGSVLSIPLLTSLTIVCRTKTLCEFDLLTNLNYISLTSINLELQMDDANFIALITCCPSLTYLHSTYNRSLTAQGIRSIASHCKKLREVNVSSDLRLELENAFLDFFPRLIYT